ncbi:hypothetical protein SK128_000469 [Halocaridina rubra]|uniref:Methyltransferase FkbM domain-containing protein n=1 Tax=Halocaridina rubra TaxID=373956 RepID=A0AAN8XJM8_HALRR
MRKTKILRLVFAIVFFFFIVLIYIDLRRYVEATILDVLMTGPMSMTDPRLISLIKSRILVAPRTGNYNLKILDHDNPVNVGYNTYLNTSLGFPPLHKLIKVIFDGRPPGFFVEAGALDGEYLSNTLYLEMEKGWKGLLVEPDKKMFNRLLQKNRKAWTANCCLAVTKYPKKEILIKQTDRNGPNDDVGFRAQNMLLSSPFAIIRDNLVRQVFDRVQCVPLQSLLKALHVTHVDFLSLDIEDSLSEATLSTLSCKM